MARIAEIIPVASTVRAAARAPRLGCGVPWPLGATPDATGVNFAIAAPAAEAVTLCVFDAAGQAQGGEYRLPGRTDGVWHGRLEGAAEGLVYGYRVHGPWSPRHGARFNPAKLLLDPYGRSIVGAYDGNELFLDHVPGDRDQPDTRDNAAVALKARVTAELPELCEADHVRVPRALTVLCELHVGGATRLHPLIAPDLRGTFAGLAQPPVVAHLKRLGVTTVNLLPLMQSVSEPRLLGLGLTNYWGYNSLGWFCPDPRFWSWREATTPQEECRAMVGELHRNGLEVILDVVFNHSPESDLDCATFGMRGIDNRLYYRASPEEPGRYENWTGCGNVLNVAEPRVLQLVMDAMRFWASRIGIDGFRFDLAPVMGRGPSGSFDPRGAFFAALAQDPVLSRAKLIAEPWDLGSGGYQLGQFPAGWAEWNDRFRDTARRFWLSGGATRAEFAQILAGSSDLFARSGRDATASVNFITAHDGFTLRDATSYRERHNLANGEGNRDGHGDNHSTNCGVEGASGDEAVLRQRSRMQRAMLATLALSMGTPMLLGGDEVGHTQRGNNNAYCQDNAGTWIDWAAADADLADYVGRCFRLRREQPLLRRQAWLSEKDVAWLACDGWPLEGGGWWSNADRAFAAVFLESDAPVLALLFNPDARARRFKLPAPGAASSWSVALCSALDERDLALPTAAHEATVPGNSMVVLVAGR